jgi:predicted transcriptional regulator
MEARSFDAPRRAGTVANQGSIVARRQGAQAGSAEMGIRRESDLEARIGSAWGWCVGRATTTEKGTETTISGSTCVRLPASQAQQHRQAIERGLVTPWFAFSVTPRGAIVAHWSAWPMTTQSHLLEVSLDRALYLGPRQLQLMRVFWAHGALTVSELLERLAADPPLAYTTLMSLCVRLYEKGLLTRRKRTEESNRLGVAYIYAPTHSEAEYTRRTIGRSLQQYFSRPDANDVSPVEAPSLAEDLAELGMLPLADGQQTIASLLERAELAEQAAAQAMVKLRQAEERIATLERRAGGRASYGHRTAPCGESGAATEQAAKAGAPQARTTRHHRRAS